MKIKNLYVASTCKVINLNYINNLNVKVNSIDNGFIIIEKRYEEISNKNKKKARYYIPGTDTEITRLIDPKLNKIYISGNTRRLNKYIKEEEINQSDIKVLEKKFDERGLARNKWR